MDNSKVGAAIKRVRRENGLTQLELAEALGLSDKTVSKWECGRGCPDISFLNKLSEILGIGLDSLLSGKLTENERNVGNMKKTVFSVCPKCHNLVVSTGDAEVCCCSRKLEPLAPIKAEGDERLRVELVDDERYITCDHPMTKDNYISFVAFVTGESVSVYRQYAEWELSLRIPARGYGMLMWYSDKDGLLWQPLGR